MDFSILSKMDANEMLAELFDPAVYKGFLQVMTHFSSYSWRNIFLIYKQMPHASMLADFDIWKEQYKRKIIRDSKSIKIYAPVPQKPKPKFVEKLDPTTGAVMLDDNEKKIMEEIFIDVPPKYKPTSYMDISQTEGAPVPRLAGDVMSDEALHGVFIDILKEMSPQIDIPNAIKQIAQNRLDGGDLESAVFVIDSIAYALYRRFGIDADIDFVGYDGFLNVEMVENICKSADDLIADIEGRFAAVCRERGLDPMTLMAAAEVKPQPEVITEVPKAVDDEKNQDTPLYTKELRTGTVVGVKFSEFDVMPLSASETSIIDEADAEPAMMPADTKPIIPAEPPVLKYPPDPTITIADRNEYGYTRPELLPLNKDRALILFRRGMTIYALDKDGTESMALYFADIRNHDGIFGVPHSAWVNSKEYISFTSGKPEDRLEAKFIFDDGDFFAVYQTEKDKTPTAYKPYEAIAAEGLNISRHDYSLVHIAPLPSSPSDTPTGLFMWVNAERLDDFNGRALMTSDVLSIKKDEIITSYYANGRTFKELLDFIGEEGRIYRFDDEVEDEIVEIVTVNESITQEKYEPPAIAETIEPKANEIPPAVDDSKAEPQAATDAAAQATTQLQQPSTEQTPSQTSNDPATPPPDPALPIIKSDAPLYRLSAKDAESHGAEGVYNDSRRVDIDCAEAIAKSITAHKKEGNSYDLVTPADSLLKRYGKERMMWVLSKHILVTKGFSETNKKWAHDFVYSDKGDNTGSGDDSPAFSINVHHAVLDAFVDRIRAALKKNPSFLERMKAAKKKSEAHNNSSG